MKRRAYAKAFGRNVDRYDQARPGYPSSLLHDVVSFASAPAPRILEVGAGSGQATLALARTGIPVHCLEPSRRMARLLRENCAGHSGVEVTATTFERWRPKGRYTLLVAAQSWHLVDPQVRLVKAAQVLRPGGAIAVCWHQMPQPFDQGTLRLLNQILHEGGFQLYGWSPPTSTNPAPTPEKGGWQQSSPCFDPVPAKRYTTRSSLSFTSYAALLETYPECRAMAAVDRQRLLARIEESVFAAGPIDASYATLLHMARRTGHDAGEPG